MTQAQYSARGDVAVVTMENPPVNGLGHGLRTGLVEAVRRAQADPAIRAIVIHGAGSAFSGGADIREFNTPKATAEPILATVIRTIEGSGKPVIAAIHAVAMGGGLELALSCHFRVASRGALIALPEVKLGILPGAGGTQRLPRILPLETAVQMIVTGEAVKSEKLADTDLFDEIVDCDLVDAAVAFARRAVAENRGLPRVRDRTIGYEDAEGFLQFCRNTVATVAKNLPAPVRCIDAIAGAVKMGFDEGLANERRLFLELVQTPESRALRHAFFGERAASKIPDVPSSTSVRTIERAAIIGAGTMGGGIAMAFANAGIGVTLLDVSQEALDHGLATIRRNYENSVKKGRITTADLETRMGRIAATLSWDDLRDADLVIEAVFEDLAVKEKVFRQIDAVAREGAILASNTSTLDLNRIAGFTQRPQDVVGLHFFSPANVMKLVEIVRGEKTGKDVLATAMKLAKKLRKTGVLAGVCDGFIGNRMLEQYLRQALYLLEEGATPQQVDRAIEKFGFAMGPFRMSDMAGNDISWYIRRRRYVEQPGMQYPRIADELCERGRFGQKTGAGWYRYETGRRDAVPDPAVDELIAKHRASIGLAARAVSDDEIVHRLVFALVNEGAKILEEGIALRASDIDMIYLTGYGFPLWRGGPMLYADQVGLYNVANRMRDFAANPHGDASFWTPAPLLLQRLAEGRGFNA